MIAWALANWRWLLPTLALAGMTVFAGLQRIEYLECQTGRVEDRLAAEKAARDFRESDSQKTAALVMRHEVEKMEAERKAQSLEDRIRHAENSDLCRGSKPLDTFFDGVRDDQRSGDRPTGDPERR